MRAAPAAGFTLLEVLVALAIFATVAATVLTAAGRSLTNAARLEEKTLAGWIADNRITELQLQTPTPAPGRANDDLDYAGRRWDLQSEIEATSEPEMRRVTVWVAPREQRGSRGALRDRAAASLTGFLAVRTAETEASDTGEGEPAAGEEGGNAGGTGAGAGSGGATGGSEGGAE